MVFRGFKSTHWLSQIDTSWRSASLDAVGRSSALTFCKLNPTSFFQHWDCGAWGCSVTVLYQHVLISNTVPFYPLFRCWQKGNRIWKGTGNFWSCVLPAYGLQCQFTPETQILPSFPNEHTQYDVISARPECSVDFTLAFSCPLSKLFLGMIQLAALIPGVTIASPASRSPTLNAPSFFAQNGQSIPKDGSGMNTIGFVNICVCLCS